MIKLIEHRYNSVRTLKVDFTEQYSIQGHERPPESGTLMLRKQGKMRWDYTRPPGKLFISDGKTIYVYMAADNRVERVPLRDTGDLRAPLAFLLGHMELKKDFRSFEVGSVADRTLLKAAAKDSHLPYDRIEMQVRSNGSIAELTVFGRDGSALQYAFTHEEPNASVPDQVFHFEIPPGAEVVNAIEYGTERK
ncbi:MAG: outer membrane lipoprotein carrier protein LolA [Acidobacteriaceae bacterium]|nr:outer membrane lipoprotein carrier protein LolA [Acidobacteriaceae bacterium]